MSDAFSHGGHNADWRVDPNQVMISIGDEVDVEVRCAHPHCQMYGRIRSTRPTPARPDDVSTWRRFSWRQSDYFVAGPRLYD